MTSDKEVRLNEKLVEESYRKYAKKMLTEGYRTNAVYIASKCLTDWLLLSYADIRDKRVLNIGCAEPIDEMFFARRVASWTAVDLVTENIKVAREIVNAEISKELAKKIFFAVADASALPFPDNTFDITVAFSTLEHIPDPDKRENAFKEAVRVTKQGGYVVITVPNKWNRSYVRWYRRARAKGETDFGYSAFYSPIELRKIFRKNGLKILRFSSEWRIFSSAFPYKYLFYLLKWFGSRMGFLGQKI